MKKRRPSKLSKPRRFQRQKLMRKCARLLAWFQWKRPEATWEAIEEAMRALETLARERHG